MNRSIVQLLSTTCLRGAWAAAALLITPVAPVRAAESWFAPETLSVGGFGTLGVISKWGAYDWKYNRNAGQRGADSDISTNEDSRLGLQLDWNPSQYWGLVAQGVALDRPDGSPPIDALEWAYVSLRPLPDTQIRLGRINTDLFLYSDSRNIGFAIPWARPPVDLYGFIPPFRINGASIEHGWDWQTIRWRAQLAAGQGHASLGNVIGTERVQINERDMLTATLTGSASGLLFKGTLARTRIFYDAPESYNEISAGLTQLAQLPVPGIDAAVEPIISNVQNGLTAIYASLGLQYDYGPWSLQAEAAQVQADHTLIASRRGYVSLSRRQGPVTLYGLVSRALPLKDALQAAAMQDALTPVIGADNAAQAQYLMAVGAYTANSQRTDQQTFSAGLRWDVTPIIALKLQVDRIHSFPQGSASWVDSDQRNAHATLATVLVDFVWGQ